MKGSDLTVFGTGESTRDYSHVIDVVQGYALVLNNKNLKGQVINFASGENTRIIDIVNYIADKFKVKIIHAAPRPGEVMRFPADISFAKSLGYKPTVSIWQGLDRYVKWAKENKEMLTRD